MLKMSAFSILLSMILICSSAVAMQDKELPLVRKQYKLQGQLPGQTGMPALFNAMVKPTEILSGSSEEVATALKQTLEILSQYDNEKKGGPLRAVRPLSAALVFLENTMKEHQVKKDLIKNLQDFHEEWAGSLYGHDTLQVASPSPEACRKVQVGLVRENEHEVTIPLHAIVGGRRGIFKTFKMLEELDNTLRGYRGVVGGGLIPKLQDFAEKWLKSVYGSDTSWIQPDDQVYFRKTGGPLETLKLLENAMRYRDDVTEDLMKELQSFTVEWIDEYETLDKEISQAMETNRVIVSNIIMQLLMSDVTKEDVNNDGKTAYDVAKDAATKTSILKKEKEEDDQRHCSWESVYGPSDYARFGSDDEN
jgi:hypothetical protein